MEFRKMFFVLSRAWDKSDALPLSHRDSMVSEVYYEVHMTHVLHTARISNVDSVMFEDELRNRPRSP